MNFLNNKYAKLLTLLLMMQAVAYYAVAMRSELIPAVPPLNTFPHTVGGWRMVQDAPLEKEVLDVLKADDTLNRLYDGPDASVANLFIAYFKTQRNGQAPHSPKNCLPGSGWQSVEDTKISFRVPAWPTPIVINKYVVARGAEKSVTLYWYHSRNRVIASEYSAKFWLVADAIRYRRSDTALVRVVVPARSEDVDRATEIGVKFIQALFPAVMQQLPL